MWQRFISTMSHMYPVKSQKSPMRPENKLSLMTALPTIIIAEPELPWCLLRIGTKPEATDLCYENKVQAKNVIKSCDVVCHPKPISADNRHALSSPGKYNKPISSRGYTSLQALWHDIL